MTPSVLAPKPSEMARQIDSALLRLPAELRLKIYEYCWTIPCEEKYLIPRTGGHKLKATYLKAQLSAICTLGSICRQIRTKAYDEYFHTTQVFLGWEHNELPRGFIEDDTNVEFDLQDNDAESRGLISNSYLLQTQARHICLNWDNSLEFPMRHYLAALRRFQNRITTLEVVSDHDWFDTRPLEDDTQEAQEEEAAVQDVYEVLWVTYGDNHSERTRSLRSIFRHGIEKAAIRTYSVELDADAVNWSVKADSPKFQRFKEDVATLVAPRKVCVSIPPC